MDNTVPLQYAAYKGYEDMVSLLIDNGADINLKDKDQKTDYDLTKNDKIKELLSK